MLERKTLIIRQITKFNVLNYRVDISWFKKFKDVLMRDETACIVCISKHDKSNYTCISNPLLLRDSYNFVYPREILIEKRNSIGLNNLKSLDELD